MRKEGLLAEGFLHCSGFVRPELSTTKKPLDVGLRGESLSSVLVRPAVRHTDGAREARRAQQF
jgi:hypothetical protein